MFLSFSEYFTVGVDNSTVASYALELMILDEKGGEVMGQNIALMVPPKRLAFLSGDARIDIEAVCSHDGEVDLRLKTDQTVLYVVLTTIAQGRFTDNAFSMALHTSKVRKLPRLAKFYFLI